MPATMPEDALIARLGARFKPFAIEMPDGQVRIVGDGEPVFRATLRNDRAVKALRSLDQGNLAEAYMRGDIDLDGDMFQPFAPRSTTDTCSPALGVSCSRSCSGRSTPTGGRSGLTMTPTNATS